MNRPKISIVGSYAAGLTMKTDRFPTNGETLLGHDFVYMHGGKGSNQAIACARHNTDVFLITCVGKDSYGEAALKLWKDESINIDSVKISPFSPTGAGFIMVDQNGDNEILVDLGANNDLDVTHIRQCRNVILESDVLIMQLEIPLLTVREALLTAQENHVLSILNPAPWQTLPKDILKNCSLITPNETEAKLMLGLAADKEIEISVLADRLLHAGLRAFVITLGSKGSFVVTKRCRELVPAFSVSAIDTTGAGDIFTASLGAALADKASLKEAVLFASAASALSVTKYGVVDSIPTFEETKKFLKQHSG